MLIPRGGLTALGGPFTNLVCVIDVVCQKHAAGTASDDLVAVERDAIIVAERTGFHPLAVQLILCSERFGCILDDQGVMRLCDSLNLLDLTGRSVQMCNDDQANIGIEFERFL